MIEAINKDVPYDKFVKLQLAADMMPDTPRDDLRALGYLGAAPDLSHGSAAFERRHGDDLHRRLG